MIASNVMPLARSSRFDRALETYISLCGLERDGQLSPLKAACSTCKTRHDISQFSLQATEQPQAQRQCRGHEGRLWICPHRVWSFCDMTSAAPTETRSCDRCFNRHLFLGPLRVTVEYPLLERSPKEPDSIGSLSEKLSIHFVFGSVLIFWQMIRSFLTALHSDCTKVSNCRSP